MRKTSTYRESKCRRNEKTPKIQDTLKMQLLRTNQRGVGISIRLVIECNMGFVQVLHPSVAS